MLRIHLGGIYDAANGDTFDIVELDRTRGFIPGTRTQDLRFWGRAFSDPALFVEYLPNGHPLTVRRLDPMEPTDRAGTHRFISSLENGATSPAPPELALMKRSAKESPYTSLGLAIDAPHKAEGDA